MKKSANYSFNSCDDEYLSNYFLIAGNSNVITWYIFVDSFEQSVWELYFVTCWNVHLICLNFTLLQDSQIKHVVVVSWNLVLEFAKPRELASLDTHLFETSNWSVGTDHIKIAGPNINLASLLHNLLKMFVIYRISPLPLFILQPTGILKSAWTQTNTFII